MFNSCSGLEVIRVDNFDTSKVTGTGLNAMFSYCKKVKTLNLNSFVNAGLGNFLGFCSNCESLEYISAQNFIWGHCTSMQGVFTNCKKLKMLDLTNFDGTTITTTVGLRLTSSFDGVTCPIYYNSNMCTANDTELTNKSNAIDVQGRLMAIYDFNNTVTTSDSAYPTLTSSTVVKTVDTQGSESHITHRVISVDVMPTAISFQSVTGLLNVDYLAVTSSCTSLEKLFYNCNRLENINTFGWDVSNVTNMISAFHAVRAKQIDMSAWNFGNNSVDTGFMFCGSSLEELVFPAMKFGTFWSIFDGCKSLKKLDLSKVDTSGVQPTGMSCAFRNCPLLSELDLSMLKLSQMGTSTNLTFEGWTSDQIVYVHDTDFQLDVSSYNATFVRRLSKLLAQYTFDNSIGDCLPTLNGITTSDYKVSDIVNDTVTTRLITMNEGDYDIAIIFQALTNLLTIEEINLSQLIEFSAPRCTSLGYTNFSNQSTSKLRRLYFEFGNTNLDIRNMQATDLRDLSFTFKNCGVTFITDENTRWSGVTSTANMFLASGLKGDQNLNFIDVSKCTNMYRTFGECYSLASVDISEWDVSSNTNLEQFFGHCTSLTNINGLDSLCTSKVTSIGSMFVNCKNLTSLDLSSWDTSSCTNMSGIFNGCSALTSVDLSSWNTSKSTSMSYMFVNCSSLTSLDLSSWYTSQCTDMSSMFRSCSKLETLNIPNFDTKNVYNVSNMFEWSTSLKTLDLSTWDTRKVTFTNAMFQGWNNTQTVYYEPPFWSIGTTTLNSNINWVIQVTRNNGYWLDMSAITEDTTITLFNENNLPTEEILTDWGDGTQNSELTHTYSTAGEYIVISNLQNGNTNNNMKGYLTKAIIYYCTTPASLFFTCTKLKEVNLTDNWVEKTIAKYGKNVSLSQVFYGCTNLETANTIQLTKFKPTHMVGTFYNCKKIKEIDLTGLDTSSVKGFNNCFAVCESISEVKGMENWDTSSATDMSSMFAFSFIPTLNLSSWDFSKVTTMYQFAKNSRITSIDLSNTTFNNTRFTEFLYNNLHITTVNLSGTNISGNMESMFLSCSKLENINLTNAIIKPSILKQTFGYCEKLTSLDTERIDVNSCKSMESTFKQCSSLTSLDLSSWDTSQCTDMSNMFNGCGASVINLANWNTDNVTSMQLMFNSCSSLEELDMSSFTTTNLNHIAYMLERCSSLKTLDMSNFDLDKFSSTQMFYNTINIDNIGLLYVSSHTVNLISQQISKDNANQQSAPITIYYQDADPSQLTPVEGVTFKKYQTPTTIQLPPHIQLHSLPDGTRDEVDIKTGILTHNIGECTWNDSTVGWGVSIGDGSTTFYHLGDWGVPNYGTIQQDMNLPLEVNGNNTIVISPNVIGVEVWGNAEARKMNIHVPMKFNNENEAKQWLKENQVTFIYRKETPTTEQLILNYNNSCDYGRILPTGMCDKYGVVNSMYTQTMTSILLDGANTWDAMEEFENTVKFTATGTTVGVENLNMLGAGGLYCDNDLFPNINDDSDVPHCRVDEAGNKFYIYVDKEMLMSPDLIGWQIWLQENNFNLIYELAEHLTYVKAYEELDPTQARWEGMDCMRDGAISYHTNSSDNITMYPTLEYVAPSINNFEVTMLEPNTDYTIYAEGINTNDTINLGGTDIGFNNGTVYTSGDNQWLRIDNNDSFYNMVITKGDTTGEVVPYFEGMTSVENPRVNTPNKNLFVLQDYNYGANDNSSGQNCVRKSENGVVTITSDNTGNYSAFDIKNGNPVLQIAGTENYNIEYMKTQTLVEGAGTYTVSFKVTSFKQSSSSTVTVNILYDDDKRIDTPSPMWVGDFSKTLTVEKKINCIVVNFWYNGYSFEWQISDIQVEKGEVTTSWVPGGGSKVSYTDLKLRSLPNGVKDTINVVTGEYIQRVGEREYQDGDLTNKNVLTDGINTAYELENPIITKLDPQTLLAYTDGTINLSSDTGLLPTTHYTVPSTNTFHLPSMKTGTRYTLKYPSASGSITIGDINYSISSDSMLFTTPLKINGDTSAIIFSDTNPENVVLLEGAYNTREVPYFTGVKSVKNPNITIIDQLSTESTTYNCETEIELRGLPNGVADKLDIIKGKLTTNVGIRPYQEGDENLSNIWTDGYETVYALSSPVVTNVTIDHPTVTTNSLIELSSDYLIPQLNYRAPSSNNFPLDLLQSNTTYTLYADTLVSGSYTLGGTKTGIYSQPHIITLGDMTDNLLTFNGDLGLSNVMLVKGNSLKTTLPPYFLGIRSVTDGHLLVEGMAGEINELTFDEGIVLRDCNGVKDIIDLITCTLTKRTGEITLTGAEGWYRADNESTTDYNVFKLTLGGLKEALVMCDTLQSVFDTKMMDCIHAHTNELCIVIANATIGGNTVNALKSWLNQHPTTVVYQLRIPIEVQLENTWTTLPPTSYSNQTEISSTVSTNSLKPMISVTIATTTLEEIVSNLEAQNAQLEEENLATMLALTDVYELMATPSVATTEPQVVTYGLRRSAEPIGMSVSPMGMVYARLVNKGFKTIEEVPYNLQAEVMYALRGME